MYAGEREDVFGLCWCSRTSVWPVVSSMPAHLGASGSRWKGVTEAVLSWWLVLSFSSPFLRYKVEFGALCCQASGNPTSSLLPSVCASLEVFSDLGYALVAHPLCSPYLWVSGPSFSRSYLCFLVLYSVFLLFLFLAVIRTGHAFNVAQCEAAEGRQSKFFRLFFFLFSAPLSLFRRRSRTFRSSQIRPGAVSSPKV